MGLYARSIVGWHVSISLVSFYMALEHHTTPSDPLIYHTDHGVQYTSYAYMNALLDHYIRPGMGAVGNCYDNIFAERLGVCLKSEYHPDTKFIDHTQIDLAVHQAIYSYNTDRSHLALNMAVLHVDYFGYRCDIPPAVIGTIEE